MTKIFISYRRDDSQYATDGIYMQLRGIFGEGNIFLDVGNIPFGVDFRQYLSKQIESHDVVLVIIGPEWAKIMRERASQANDFVRIEIENALQSNKLVIPVLVMGATMPDFSDLPTSVTDLQWRNSAQIRRHPDLENDCKRLADGIKSHFAKQKKAVPPKTESSSGMKIARRELAASEVDPDILEQLKSNKPVNDKRDINPLIKFDD
jgi:hypothetical protein